MPRVLLVLPATGYRTEDFVAAARALGADVAVASDRGQAIRRTLRVDLADPERAADAIVREAGRRPLDAVVAADEAGVMAAAIASQRLGLRSNPPEATARTRDKLAMRRALADSGVAQPGFTPLPPGHEPLGPYPVVVKPLSLAGGRGVIRADDAAAAREAARRVRRMLDDPRATLLSEEYVPGSEVAVEALLRGGTLEVLAVFDKPDPLVGPYFEETIYVTPSRHTAAAVTAAGETTAAAARALGLREGPVHAELRLGTAGPVVIELAARSIGGLCARTLRFGLGMSLEELILRHALGMPLAGRLRREGAAAGVMMLPIPAAGTLMRVAGVDDARAVALVEDVRITIPAGRPVVPLPEGDRYLGFVFARGETPAAVERALREAHAALDVVIEPV
jgi:biotin carboxylase